MVGSSSECGDGGETWRRNGGLSGMRNDERGGGVFRKLKCGGGVELRSAVVER